MRRTIKRGRIILAATTAATLAGCGDDGTATDTDTATGSSTGMGTSMTTTSTTSMADETTDGTTQDDATAGPGTDTADGSSTAVTGSTDTVTTGATDTDTDSSSSSTGGGQASLTPDEVCRFPMSVYESPFTPGAKGDLSIFAGPQSFNEGLEFPLVEGSSGDDQINLSNFYGNSFPCVVAGDGDDFIEYEYNEGGSYAVISGGLGADVFAYRYRGATPYSTIAITTIVDFESGVDSIFIDGADLPGTYVGETTIQFQAFDPVDTPPAGLSILVDSADGEIWLTQGTGEPASAQLLQVDGDTLVDGDVVLGSTVPGCPDKFTETGTYQDFRTSGPVGEVSTADPLGGAPFEPVSNSITYGNQGNDAISTASAVSSGTDVCFAGSDGDDILIQRSFAPNELSTAYFSGGDGADMFAIGYSLGELGSAISVTTITDFEPSVDTLAISPDMVGAGEVSEASVQFINGFDGTSAPLGRNIIVDTTDGEVWVADPSDGSTLIVLLSDAPVITEDDIVFVPPAV